MKPTKEQLRTWARTPLVAEKRIEGNAGFVAESKAGIVETLENGDRVTLERVGPTTLRVVDYEEHKHYDH